MKGLGGPDTVSLNPFLSSGVFSRACWVVESVRFPAVESDRLLEQEQLLMITRFTIIGHLANRVQPLSLEMGSWN